SGAAGLVAYDPHGEPISVMGFTVARGKIVAIDALSDPERLRRLNLDDLLPPSSSSSRPPGLQDGAAPLQRHTAAFAAAQCRLGAPLPLVDVEDRGWRIGRLASHRAFQAGKVRGHARVVPVGDSRQVLGEDALQLSVLSVPFVHIEGP